MEIFVLCLAPFLYHQFLFWTYSIALLLFADRPTVQVSSNRTNVTTSAHAQKQLEKKPKASSWALRYKLQPTAGWHLPVREFMKNRADGLIQSRSDVGRAYQVLEGCAEESISIDAAFLSSSGPTKMILHLFAVLESDAFHR